MKSILAMSAALFLVAGCATTADDIPSLPDASAVADASDPEREVCRRVEQTGTRFHRTVCMSAEEWADQQAEAQEVTSRMQRETAPREECIFDASGC